MVIEQAEILAVRVEEAARRLSISRSLAWSMVWSGELRSVYLGRRRLVPVQALSELLTAAGEGDA